MACPCSTIILLTEKRACVLLDTESINHLCWPHPTIAQLLLLAELQLEISCQIANSPIFFPHWLYGNIVFEYSTVSGRRRFLLARLRHYLNNNHCMAIAWNGTENAAFH